MNDTQMTTETESFTTEQLLAAAREANEKLTNQLQVRERELQQQLKEIQKVQREISGIGGKTRVRSVRRTIVGTEATIGSAVLTSPSGTIQPVGEKISLSKRIAKALESAPENRMTIKEILEKVTHDGWTTSSDNPYSVVAASLSNNKRFVRVGEGVWSLVVQ